MAAEIGRGSGVGGGEVAGDVDDVVVGVQNVGQVVALVAGSAPSVG